MATGVLTTALSLATLAPVASADPGVPPPTGPHTQAAPNDEGPQRWAPPLAGTSTGVAITEGTARLSTMRDGTETGPAALRGAERQGLLDLGAHQFATPVNRIDAPVTGDVPPGSQVAVDVRGQDADGQWSEWLPAEPGSPAVLPEPTRTVAVRLAMLAPTGSAGPVVRSLEVLADEVPTGPRTIAPRASYRVFATREGLVGGVTANGHRISAERPVRRAALAPRALAERARRLQRARLRRRPGAAPPCRCGTSGPGTPRTTTGTRRTSASSGRTCRRAARRPRPRSRTSYNGGRDGFGRQVKNPAGIDLADGTFWTASACATTRSSPSTTSGPAKSAALGRAATAGAGPVVERATPDAAAPDGGVVGDGAQVEVQCQVAGSSRHRHPGHQQPLAAHPAGALRPGRVDPGRAAGTALHLASRR